MRKAAKVRLKGLGVPDMKQGRGDEYVEVTIDVPRKLTDKQGSFSKKLGEEGL